MTIRQDCIRWAKQHGIEISGNTKTGICISGKQWVTVFETWEEIQEVFKQSTHVGFVTAIERVSHPHEHI